MVAAPLAVHLLWNTDVHNTLNDFAVLSLFFFLCFISLKPFYLTLTMALKTPLSLSDCWCLRHPAVQPMDKMTASARHPAAQPRPGRRRRGGSMTASARHPAAQPRQGRRRPMNARMASARQPAAQPRQGRRRPMDAMTASARQQPAQPRPRR